MSAPLLSVILPTFNASAVLGGCLESLASFAPQDQLEVVVVDGGSQDGTMTLAKTFAARIPNLRFEVGKDRGIYDAMNKGVALATGQWLYFTGADDRWLNAPRLGEILASARADADMVQVAVLPCGSPVMKRKITPGRMLAGETFNHQALFYRRSFVGDARYSLEYPLAADHLFNLEMVVRRRAKVFHVPELLVEYANTGVSAQRKDERWLADQNRWLEEMFSPQAVARRERWRPRERWVKRMVRLVAGKRAARWAVEKTWDGLYGR